jgi:hypothetical protein
MMKREHVPVVVSGLIGGRPARWAPAERMVGDFDGRDRTLEVFNANVADQRASLEAIDRDRARLEEAAGGPLVIIFHSVRQSEARYGEFLAAFERSFPRVIEAPTVLTPPADRCVDRDDDAGPHREPAAA